MGRDHSKIIWRTVVFAGAMLGTAACGGKAAQPPTTPSNDATATDVAKPDPATATPTPNPCGANPCNPCGANPCGDDRIRGSDDEGATGRGFILS
jgi:hypothetical protein